MGRPENHRASDKKYAGEIFSGLPLKIQLTLSEVSRWIPQLKKLKNDLWRPLIVGVLACHMAACQPTRGFEDQTPPSTTPIVEPYHPQPTPELTPISPLELTPTPEPTPMATPGPTISGETLTISDSQLELKEFDGEAIAQLINASEKGWQVITNDKGKISFFSGYAGEAGKESQVVVLAQGPENYQWNPDNQLWQKDNQVVIPDILLPESWNEEKQMAGPAYETDTVFLFKDESGNYRIGVVYNPEKVAQISDKSNLEILPNGSGLYVGSPKNYELQEGQQIIRDEDGNLRLINADGNYLLMRTSWSQVTSPNQLYQAGTFAGPFEAQPILPYPTDEIVQELGITNYQVVDNHYIALQEVVDQQTGETHQYIIAQAITNKEGKFRDWQRTIPFAVETGLAVPHPQETNPELFDLKKSDAPIPQFVNAMRMGGIEVNPEEVANNLQYQTITSADGKQYVIGTFNLDPDPNQQGETLEGLIPLMMWSEEGGWSRTWMKDIAKLLGIEIGDSLVYKKSDFSIVSSRRYHEMLAQNSSVLTLSQGFYWRWFERSMDAPIDPYSRSDILSQIQIINKMKNLNPNLRIRISPFGSFPQNDPEWLNGLSRNEAEIQLREHMQQVYDLLTRNGIAGDEYVVINEPFFQGSGWTREDQLYRIFGNYDYIIYAFRTAREIVGPNAVLIYNDTANNSQYQRPYNYYTSLTRQNIRRLSEAGIDNIAVGMQMHLVGNVPIDEQDLITTMQQYGVPVYITELDVDVSMIPEQTRQLKSAEIYASVYRAAIRSGVCRSISTWESVDELSWYVQYLNKPKASATLFFNPDNPEPKPAYYAVLKTLFNAAFYE